VRSISAGLPAIRLLLSALALAGSVSIAARPARSDAADPGDWSVAVPVRLVYDVAWSGGRIYAAVDPGGILIYDPASGRFEEFTTEHGLGSNRVQCVSVSEDGEVWVGTADAGIARLLGDGRTRYITGLPDQLDVRALAFAGDNAYYGGPNGGGRIVNGLPERSFTLNEGLVSEDVRSVAARGAKAWFGTPMGISEFDIQLNGLTTRNDGLTDIDIRALAVAGGRVYAGTASGLVVLDETDPGAPVWTTAQPAIEVEIVDLAVSGDRLAVLGTDRRLWWRDQPDGPWTFTGVGQPGHRFLAVTIDDQGGIRLGGRRFDPTPIGNDFTPLFVDLDGAESPYYRRLYGTQFFGMGPDREGGAWVGAFPVDAAVSHWRADGSIVSYTDEETGNAIDGFNGDGWLDRLKIDVFEASDGALWVSAFQAGVTRMVPAPDGDPAGATYLHLTPQNSPLNMDRVFSMGEDPHGNIWFCAAGELVDGDFNAGIDVLLAPDGPFDPDRAVDPAAWVSIRPNNSPLAGEGLNRISFDGDRVAWLTIRGTGIQRFDYGDGSGFDPSRVSEPARWRTITALPETRGDNLTGAREVAIGPGGRHWVATDGDGVFSFDYVAGPIFDARQYRAESFGARLLSDNVQSVAVDASGAAWVVTPLGLNRIREDGFDARGDTYTDLQNFLEFGLGELYSAQILRPMAGGIPVTARVSDAGPFLFVVSGRGLTRVDLQEDPTGPASDDDPGFTIYPNPVREPEQEIVIDGFEGVADAVEIYDLEGRRIKRRTDIEPGDDIGRLETVRGEPVANGLYLVRFVLGGRVTFRVLAVER
jgi:hypothetical protein